MGFLSRLKRRTVIKALVGLGTAIAAATTGHYMNPDLTQAVIETISTVVIETVP